MESEYQSNLLDTTDSLEAVGVFRGWKNFLFVIVLLCLLLVQGAFWLVAGGCVNLPQQTSGPQDAGATTTAADVNIASVAPAEIVSTEPNQPIEKTDSARSGKGTLARVLPFEMTFARLSWAIRLVNTLLVLAAVLYCLAILFGLKISLLGRLGGISHVSRAFFLSLIVVVLLLPWQKVFGKLVTGMIYTPAELADWAGADKSDILDKVLYYLRFTGYWVLVLLLVILCQIRSSRWTKAILRRLEVI